MKKKRWLLGLLLVLVLLSGCSGMQKTTFTSLEDLNSPSVKIGVATGSASDFAAREAMPNAEFVDFVAVPDGCAALAAGKIDAFLFDRVNLEYFALNNPGNVIMAEGFGEPARVRWAGLWMIHPSANRSMRFLSDCVRTEPCRICNSGGCAPRSMKCPNSKSRRIPRVHCG